MPTTARSSDWMVTSRPRAGLTSLRAASGATSSRSSTSSTSRPPLPQRVPPTISGWTTTASWRGGGYTRPCRPAGRSAKRASIRGAPAGPSARSARTVAGESCRPLSPASARTSWKPFATWMPACGASGTKGRGGSKKCVPAYAAPMWRAPRNGHNGSWRGR